MTEATPPGPPAGPGAPLPGGAGQGGASVGTLLAGMLVWGGAGYGLDRLLGITVLFPVGVLVGLAASVYLVYVSSGPSS